MGTKRRKEKQRQKNGHEKYIELSKDSAEK